MKYPSDKFFSCKRKKSHATYIDAIGAIMEQKDYENLKFYSCDYCGAGIWRIRTRFG